MFEDAVGPLVGYRVVVLAGMGPVPLTSMLLADMGAQVVRIARPAHRTKRALTQINGLGVEQDVVGRGVEIAEVDLKDPFGVEQVRRLSSVADVFIEGFRPGVTERLGLGPDLLIGRNPALVYARLTGYGQTGPLASRAGHDLNYLAHSGVLHALGRDDEAPRPPANLLGDVAGGGLVSAFGIVCALLEARSSGRGQVVDAAMIDGAALLTAKLQGLRAAGLYSDKAGSNWLDGAAPYYGTYRCADGFVAVGALEDDFYAEFVSRLGVDTFGWPARDDGEQWPQLRALIADALSRKSRAQWAAIFSGTDACVTPVLTFEEAASDPHNMQRDLFQQVGMVQHPAPSPRFSRTPGREPSVPNAIALDPELLLSMWEGTKRASTDNNSR